MPRQPVAVRLSAGDGLDLAPGAVAAADGGLEVSYALTAEDTPLTVDVVATPIDEASRPDQDILVYYDPAYPLRLTSVRSVYGLYDHLTVEARLRRYPGEVRLANTAALTDLFRSSRPAVVVVGTGAIADGLAPGGDVELVRSWVERGGTLVWLGQGMGEPGTMLARTRPAVPVPCWDISDELFGYDLVAGEQRWAATRFTSYATEDSALSAALGLRYPYTLRGGLVAELERHDDLVLGKVQDAAGSARTAISLARVGDGNVILFGFGLFDEEVDVAHDISQIISSGLLHTSRADASHATVTLAAGERHTGRFVMPAVAGDVASVRLLVTYRGEGPTRYVVTDVPVAPRPAAALAGRGGPR